MIHAFSADVRPKLISSLTERNWDLVIIGGGVVGAAVARDAALRGLQVALIEAQDFASGTSSGSTKLLHGGVRYLENFEFKLVSEAIQERERLHRLYSPLVKDVSFVFPTYRSIPPARWKLNLGLLLYDAFSGFRQRHQNLNRDNALKKFPLLEDANLTGACVYTDSFSEDYRLVIELIKAAHRHGAVCLNRMQLSGVRIEPDGRFALQIVDRTNPTVEPLRARTRYVFNCTGPFSDRVRSFVGLPPVLRLTQGVHFLVRHDKLPVHQPYVVVDQALHRILFAIPWNKMTYVGTTDTSIGRPEEARAQKADRDYVFSQINKAFRTKLKPEDAYQSWAGVRPLIEPKDKTKDNSKISREHLIEENPPRFFHILGGKLTSHRLMAEEALDGLTKYQKIAATRTRGLPLQEAQSDGSFKTQPSHLAETYGRFAHDILRIDRERNLNLAPLHSKFSVLKSELLYGLENEMVLEPIDFLKRRSSLFYESDGDDQSTQELVKTVVEMMASSLHWTTTMRIEMEESVWKAYQWNREGFRG